MKKLLMLLAIFSVLNMQIMKAADAEAKGLEELIPLQNGDLASVGNGRIKILRQFNQNAQWQVIHSYKGDTLKQLKNGDLVSYSNGHQGGIKIHSLKENKWTFFKNFSYSNNEKKLRLLEVILGL